MMMEFKTSSLAYWGRHLWARGSFVASSGNVPDEVIMKYIDQQSIESPPGYFKKVISHRTLRGARLRGPGIEPCP